MSQRLTVTVGPKEDDNPIFGQYLNDLRIAKRFSRADVSDLLGVTSEYLRMIERGKRTPALGTTIKMFEIYGVPYTRNRSQITLDNASINFTSRIKEARHAFPELTRDELIGQIVKFLVVTDDDTLRKFYSQLVK